MKLVLLAVGRMKAGPERDLLKRYLDRAAAAGRGLGLALQATEIDESRARSAEARMREEAAMLAGKLPVGGTALLLDERGTPLTSPSLAAEVERTRDGGVGVMTLVIGGPDGLDPAFRAAHRCIAFGAATFPHQLVRVILAEQLYRVTTILAGHPYHRA